MASGLKDDAYIATDLVDVQPRVNLPDGSLAATTVRLVVMDNGSIRKQKWYGS